MQTAILAGQAEKTPAGVAADLHNKLKNKDIFFILGWPAPC
jgi:hypothetical protein